MAILELTVLLKVEFDSLEKVIIINIAVVLITGAQGFLLGK